MLSTPRLAERYYDSAATQCHNGNYKILRLERQNPEAPQLLGEKMLAEWVAER